MSDYDGFADQYDQTFELAPFRTHIEAYSLLKTVGDVRGQAWLDLACGTGPYARALRRRGADPSAPSNSPSFGMLPTSCCGYAMPSGSCCSAARATRSMSGDRSTPSTGSARDRSLSSGPTTSTSRSASSSTASGRPAHPTAPDGSTRRHPNAPYR